MKSRGGQGLVDKSAKLQIVKVGFGETPIPPQAQDKGNPLARMPGAGGMNEGKFWVSGWTILELI